MQNIQIVDELYPNPVKAPFTHFKIQSVIERLFDNEDENYIEPLISLDQLESDQLDSKGNYKYLTYYTLYGLNKGDLINPVYEDISDHRTVEQARAMLTKIFGVSFGDQIKDEKRKSRNA